MAIQYHTSHCSLQVCLTAVLHLQIISLFANTTELMLMPRYLIVSKSGNSK